MELLTRGTQGQRANGENVTPGVARSLPARGKVPIGPPPRQPAVAEFPAGRVGPWPFSRVVVCYAKVTSTNPRGHVVLLQASTSTAAPRAKTGRSHCRLRGPESLEHRRALAVTATAAIESFVMPIGSATQPVVIRLADHFDGGGSPLTYSVTTSSGFAAATIDAEGLLTIKASSLVKPGYTIATDNLVVRATSTTTAEFREAAFTVYQKAPTRFANAMVATSGTNTWVTQTRITNGVSADFLQPVAVGQPASPVLAQSGDFDGDLGDDFAWIDATGGVWVNRSLGVASGTPPQLWGRLPSDVRWESITVRDFTGDGRADIAARNARNGNWRLLKSDGVRFSDPQRFGNWSPGVAWEHVVAGDFDGNGSADLAARDPASGEWWVSRSTDLGFTPTRFGARSVPWSECFVGDFNADGRSDLAGRNPATGRWRVFTSAGDRFAAGRVFGTWTTDVPWADATIGDVDGDGRSDLLGRNPTSGEWLVSRSTGTAFTTSTFRGFANPQISRSFVVGDFNFDGKTDIAGRNHVTGIWRLLQGNGTRFDRSPVIGTWPTTTSLSHVLPLRIPYVLSRLDPPVMGGNIAGGFSGGSLAILPTWTTPSPGTSTSIPSTPNQGSSSGVLQVTLDPATTNGGSLVPNQPSTSGVTSGVSFGTGTLVLSGSGTGASTGTVTISYADWLKIAGDRTFGSGSLSIGSGTSAITSSTAAAGGGRPVGWIDNDNASATGFAFAAAGDTNLDWKVDIIDAANFLAGGRFDSGTPASWNQGDFTYDGTVDVLDAANFQASGLFKAGTANAPPSTGGSRISL